MLPRCGVSHLGLAHAPSATVAHGGLSLLSPPVDVGRIGHLEDEPGINLLMPALIVVQALIHAHQVFVHASCLSLRNLQIIDTLRGVGGAAGVLW